MTLYPLLVGSMWRIMCDIASTKTDRYFLSNIEKQKADDLTEYPKLVCDVVRTFCVILTKQSKSSMVLAEGENFPVADYQFPEHWWELARARRVYATQGSIEFADPYFVVESTVGECITPSRVLRFFEGYNQNQLETSRLKLAGVPSDFNDYAYLGMFKTLMFDDSVGDNNMASGVFDEMVSQVLNIPHPLDARFVKTWERYEERSVDKWLMSVV